MRIRLPSLLRIISVFILLTASVKTVSAQVRSGNDNGKNEQRAVEMEKAVRAIEESYYTGKGKEFDVTALKAGSLEDIVSSLDEESRIIDRKPSSLGFVRGLEEEGTIARAELLERDFNYIGYMRLKYFSRRTNRDFKNAMGNLGDMDGFILDLRDNPGGFLQSALDVLGNFISGGKLLLTEVRRKGSEQHFAHTRALPTLTEDIPIVVLINASTASSAEIVAATLRHYRDAVIVGQKSHGKGTIQDVIPLSAKKTLILTTGEYILADGSSFRDSGIVPDRLVEGEREQFETAV
ncbi:MAG: hypothetical protein J3T61_02475, partial [Candidatus Brocadiales bacterium]|nr:hypothetical protein [Candidatus Bathyanammoxibius sp.]